MNDLLVTGSSVANIVKFKKRMSKEFNMSDLNKLSYYLRIEVDQGRNGTELKNKLLMQRYCLKKLIWGV